MFEGFVAVGPMINNRSFRFLQIFEYKETVDKWFQISMKLSQTFPFQELFVYYLSSLAIEREKFTTSSEGGTYVNFKLLHIYLLIFFTSYEIENFLYPFWGWQKTQYLSWPYKITTTRLGSYMVLFKQIAQYYIASSVNTVPCFYNFLHTYLFENENNL